MSRCFPFPPPGYEKKSRVENTDVLSKEKHKEKKHTKDKKEKEKKEGKEKKDKDKSKEKHRDKKDRKDKHKDKEKNRNKEKNHTSDKKRVEGQPRFSFVENFGSNNLQNNEIKDSEYVQELAKRITDEGKVSGSQMVQKVPATDQRSEARGMAAESSISSQHGGKRKTNGKNEDQWKPNGHRNYIDGRGLEKVFDEKLSIIYRGGVEGISQPLEKDAENLMEEKEKIKIKETDGKGGKHKDKDREKSRKSKEKDTGKEQKMKEMTQANKDQAKPKESSFNLKDTCPKLNGSSPKRKESCPKVKGSGKDFLDFRNAKSTDSMKLSSINSADEENPGKRKELEMNGYIIDKGIRPSKFARTLTSSDPVIENGRKSELCQTSVHFASEKQAPGINYRADIKDHKLNGLMAVEKSNIGSTKPLPADAAVNENGEASKRQPHPDLKYLDQILSVPKTVEWPELIDNEWLFSSSHPQSRKPSVHSPGIDDGSRQVWAEALHLESADISALPYVIPY